MLTLFVCHVVIISCINAIIVIINIVSVIVIVSTWLLLLAMTVPC